jgi:putative oxidoreductase
VRRSRVITLDPKWTAYSLGALRIVTAFLFIHHGLGKVYGPNPVDPWSLRGLAAVLELAGGPILMSGLFTRPLAFVLSGQMAVAYFLSHAPNGFWESFAGPNQQAAVLNCFLFLLFWAAGPGAWSLDGLWRRRSATATQALGAARGTQ